MRVPHFCSSILSALFLLLVFVTSLTGQIVVEEITGHPDTSSWALHEASGKIFAAVKSTDSVVEYNHQGRELRTYSVDPEPTEMIIKGDHLVVACQKSSSVSVIDIKQNKVLGKVEFVGEGPYGLFCSKVDNNLVYGISNTGTAWWEGEIFQVDLEALEVRKRLKVQGWRQSHPINVAMSADGKWIIPDARGKSSPSGADLIKVDEDAFKFEQIRRHHRSFGQIKAGPANRFWTLGNMLYPLDIEASIRSFEGSPVAIHPTLDLVASFKGSEISLEKFSDSKDLLSVPISLTEKEEPAPEANGGQQARRRPPTRRSRSSSSSKKNKVLIGFDLKRSSVVLGTGRFCRIIDLTELDISPDPLVMIDMPSEIARKPGETIRIPIKLTNDSLISKAKFELKSGPEGAKISDGELVWTPQSSDLGLQSLVILARVGDSSDKLTLNVDVKSSSIELDFTISGLDVDSEGKFAVAWGEKFDPSGQRQRHPMEFGTDQVAVLDLSQQKVIVQKPLTSGVVSAIINGEHVFLVPKSGNVIFRFNKATLGDSKRHFLNDRVGKLLKYARGLIGITNSGSNRKIDLIDPETMKPVKTKNFGHFPRGTGGISEVAPGILSIYNDLINLDDETSPMLTSSLGLPLLANTTSRITASQSHGMPTGAVKIYGKNTWRNSINDANGNLVARFSGSLYPTPYYPVAFSIRTQVTTVGRSRRKTLSLESVSLVDGQILDARVFDVSSGDNDQSYSQENRFFPFANHVVYAAGRKIFSIPLVTSELKSAPIPIHFQFTKVPVLGVRKPQKLQFKAIGGKGKIEYQLLTQFPGVDLDSKTGEVTIDTPQLWKNFVARSRNESRSGTSRSRISIKPTLFDYKTVTGHKKPTDAYPTVLPLKLAAIDDEGQQDHLTIFLIVNGSIQQFNKMKAQVQSEFFEAQKKAQRDREERMQKQAEARRIAEEKALELAKQQQMLTGGSKIEELEKRVRRMEATLDAILQKLDDLEKRKTP